MKYELTTTSITVVVDNPDCANPHHLCLTPMRVLSDQEIERLLEPTCKWLAAYKYRTILNYLRAVKRFGQFLMDSSTISLPKSDEEWQRLIVECYSWQLSSKMGGALATRQTQWHESLMVWFRILQAAEVIPARLVFPKVRLKRQVSSHGSALKPRSLGENGQSKDARRGTRSKTLAGDLWASNDLEYLRSIEMTLSHRVQVLQQVVDDYWLSLVRDFHTGRKLMRIIPEVELMARVQYGNWSSNDACGQSAEVLSLCLLRNLLDTSDSLHCLLSAPLNEFGGCGTLFSCGGDSAKGELLTKSRMSGTQAQSYSYVMLCMRFLGILNHIDIAVACVILIQEHPTLNPQSLLNAKILEEHGKSILVDPGPGGEMVFSVDKPRAGCRKYVTLSPRAARVLRHVIRVTDPVRKLLRRANSPLWRHLFVGNAGRYFGRPVVDSRQLTSKIGPSLARFYPELAEAGLTVGTLDFAKVRVTHGLLEWFKTGSVRTVSRKLGNSVQITLEHYIPEELIHLWNERILRRFQNTLIVMASGKKGQMLAVSDLKSETELNLFLQAIAVDFPRATTPIGPYLHDLLPLKNPDNVTPAESTAKSLLSTRVDPYSLALLYAYCEVFEASKLDSPTMGPKLASLRDIVELGRFLRLLASNDDVGDALHEVLQVRKLRQVHEQALPLVPSLRLLLESRGEDA